MPPTTNENSAGPVIATVIILAVIILGGLYFWGERSNREEGLYQDSAADASDQSTSAIKSQSSSDDTDSIEADINNTNVDSLDAELQAS
ncbi:hypothetical protein KW796_03095 [Candidatus Parcubacteria bacterium]|nr:hypothetical protein [Candidatus Parcubacteria bacterium]